MLFGVSCHLPFTELELGEHHGLPVVCLSSVRIPSFEFCVAARNDVICFSTSRVFLRHALQLIEGTTRVPALDAEGAAEGEVLGSGAARPSAWLRSSSSFFRDESKSGFELVTRPTQLFTDLLDGDPLLSDWDHFRAVGDFVPGSLACTFETAFAGGKSELARVAVRSLVEPFDDLALLLYGEVPVLLPPPASVLDVETDVDDDAEEPAGDGGLGGDDRSRPPASLDALLGALRDWAREGWKASGAVTSVATADVERGPGRGAGAREGFLRGKIVVTIQSNVSN